MVEFIKYILQEVKNKRLTKESAVALIADYQSNSGLGTPNHLHPLLHKNTSTFTQQRFSSLLTGEEFFLKDHIINGKALLPAVAYLEMAIAALMESIEDTVLPLQLSYVTWSSPFVVEAEAKAISILLTVDSDSSISFEVESEGGVHCQGRVEAVEINRLKAEPVDIAALIGHFEVHSISTSDWYQKFAEAGLNYGDGYQGIKQVYVRSLPDGRKEILTKIALPASVSATGSNYTLHPSLLDAALQAGAEIFRSETMETRVPFSVEGVTVYKSVPEALWTWIRHSSDSKQSFPKLDIDILDNEGNLCVELRGYSTRVIETKETANNIVYLGQIWQKKSVNIPPAINRYDQKVKFVIGLPELETFPFEHRKFSTEAEETAERYIDLVKQLFAEIQKLFTSKDKTSKLLQVIVSDDLLLGLAGLLKTVKLENPKITTQLIKVDSTISASELNYLLEQECKSFPDEVIKYEQGERYVLQVQELSKSPGNIFWRNSGIYLITGGVGEIGLRLATEIVQKTTHPTLILVGRSDLSREKQSQLEALRSHGAIVEYHKLDIADRAATNELLSIISAKYQTLNGVIHSAGLTKDSFIIKKSIEELESVLAPKVRGTINLDLATRAFPLDFFILFSSVSGVFGNAGQADYATANGFMDVYAQKRDQLFGQNHGKSISISWPLWEEGGMKVDRQMLQKFEDEIGVKPLKTDTAMNVLYSAIEMSHSHLTVITGDTAKIRAQLLKNVNVEATFVPTKSTSRLSIDEIEQELCHKVATMLGIASNEIDLESSFEELGFEHTELALLAEAVSSDFYVRITTANLHNGNSLRELALLIQRQVKADVTDETMQEVSNVSKGMPQENRQKEDRVGIDSLADKTRAFFKQLFSSTSKLAVERIDADTPFDSYGLDSIMSMQMVSNLEKLFGAVSKTLFFEFQTINEITNYFLQEYRDRLPSIVGEDESKARRLEQPQQTSKPEVPRVKDNKISIKKPLRSISTGAEKSSYDIAIIGLAGRYPKSANLDEFWQNLCGGVNCVSEIPLERWDYQQFFDEDKNKPGKTYSKWGGFITGVDEFDASFFNISSLEASFMDPQEKLFLQCIYHVIEDAGYTRHTISSKEAPGVDGKVAVFVGAMYQEYQLYGVQHTTLGEPVSLSSPLASIANRVSYFFNFNGPSVTVDTMSSSSLTAMHLACESLLSGSSKMAIAGGINISIHPNKYLLLSQGKFVSSNGRCASFGDGGDGYVPSEGVGAVLLKPLKQAIADGDHIYGVIKGSAIGHSGRTSGYTMPSPSAQANVIKEALERASVDIESISYVEAHGIGTALGDPIEISGLSRAFAAHTDKKQFCAIGSVKSNIGHCESAAGMAGLTKVLLQMKHGMLVPSLNSEPPNPNINFEETPFIVQQKLQEWHRKTMIKAGQKIEYPRRAGLSSFGAGGSNAHFIIEEYTGNNQTRVVSNDPVLIILSAKDEAKLRLLAESFIEVLEKGYLSDIDLISIAYTLQTGREAMEYRFATEVTSIDQLCNRLKELVSGKGQADIYLGNTKSNDDLIYKLSNDEDMLQTISAWLEKRKYPQLAEIWVKGFSIDWFKLYTSFPAKISLPTYPFSKERHWFPAPFTVLNSATV